MSKLDGGVFKYFEGKTILVTGATGFLAKIFVEKILRLQPNVKKLYILLRAIDAEPAKQRLHTEIVNKELFRNVREDWGPEFDLFVSSKVVAVPGDVSYSENLGIRDSILREEMWREINIVVNSAATTGFMERYDVSLAINTFGALNVINFAKRCDKIEMFLHISTAYVCGGKGGLLLEKPFFMGETLKESYTNNLDIIEEKRMVEEKLEELQLHRTSERAIKSAMKDFGLERAKLYGWPSTYVFTKAMGEMLIGKNRGKFPLVILRPTIIGSTYKEPFPGWIDGLIRGVDLVIVKYGKGKLPYFLGDPDTVFDVIPADMVVNAMIAVMAAHGNNQSCETIYHVSSSLSNPLKASDIHDFMYRYFKTNPWINKDGSLFKVDRLTLFKTMDGFLQFMEIRYGIPLKGLYLVNALCCQYFTKIYTNLDRKIQSATRIAELYAPYLFFKGIFDDKNLEELKWKAEEIGMDLGLLNFDPKCIDWEDYFMNVQIPGLSMHAVNI